MTIRKMENTSPLLDMAFPLRPESPQDHSFAPHLPLLPISASSNKSETKISAATEISESLRDAEDQIPPKRGIPSAICRRLYVSHFLSTWNSRSFEFGAVLFLAAIFPATLLPMSVYALVRSGSAIFLAPMIGRAIDGRDRLWVVRFSIVAGRAAVIISCLGFWVLCTYVALPFSARCAIFGFLTLLSCVEKPCSVLNLVAVERDWAVVIAENDDASLQILNARMRRIDLVCKLAGPLFIALIDGASTKMAISFTIGINIISVPTEYFAIAQVYASAPLLQFPKDAKSAYTDPEAFDSPASAAFPRYYIPHWIHTLYQDVQFYSQHRAFLPSFVLSLLYFTILSLGGQMVTYLLSVGYTADHIALVRTLSCLFELSATWIAPLAIRRLHPVRAGMSFLAWQMLWLGVGIIFFFLEPGSSVIAASGLVAGTILSRIGLWGYDLCAQFIIQEEVQATHRGSFSSTEASLQNAFDLLSYVATIYWSRAAQFGAPVLLSAGAVYTAGFLFSVFARRERRGQRGARMSECAYEVVEQTGES